MVSKTPNANNNIIKWEHMQKRLKYEETLIDQSK